MTEQELQVAVKALIQALPDYDNDNVTVNDWSRLDMGLPGSPVAIVGTGDRLRGTPGAREYGVVVILVEPFTEWDTTLGNMSARRDAVATQLLNEAVGLNSTLFEAVEDIGVYPGDADLDNPPYLVQTFVLTCLQRA